MIDINRRKSGSSETMTCEERLSHAIQIDSIKIHANSTISVESISNRKVEETFQQRIERKGSKNKYYDSVKTLFGGKSLDSTNTQQDEDQWNKFNKGKDQTWYFALADCHGALEIYQDAKTKKDHLLGLDLFWKDDTEKKDWKKTLVEREQDAEDAKNLKVGVPSENLDTDSFEETELLDENVRH